MLLLHTGAVADAGAVAESAACVLFIPVRRTFCATSGDLRQVASGRCHRSRACWGMNTTLRQQLLEQVITIIRSARPLVEAIERKDRDLSSQLKRSLNSIALNVAEAFGAHAGNARLSFRRALGELYESQASLQVAAAWGYITEAQAQAVVSELTTLGGRLTGFRGVRRG